MSDESPLALIRESLAADRATLRAAVERVPPELRDRRPSAGRWSVAELLEHLAIVEERTVMALTPLVVNAPALEAETTPSPTPIDRAHLRNRSLAFVAPDPIQPTGGLDANAAWARLEQSRAGLATIIHKCEGRDLRAIARTHPALGPMDGYQWLAAVGGHEERHALQILEIASSFTQDASGA
jgi:hypothetical protein